MKHHTAHQPTMIALQLKIREYTEKEKAPPAMVVLKTYLYTSLLDEIGDGCYSVPEHRFTNMIKFQGVIVMADTVGLLDPNEKYCLMKKIILQ